MGAKQPAGLRAKSDPLFCPQIPVKTTELEILRTAFQ
jgi:hypothetical protein